MSDKKVLSFDEYVADDDVTLEPVETKRGLLNIGSCSSAEILEWFEENDATFEDGRPDNEKRKFKGLRLVVRCIINADGTRISKEMRPSAIAALKNHDQRENGRLMAAAFRVNGLRVTAVPAAEKTPNDSSETASGVSPIASPSPQGK